MNSVRTNLQAQLEDVGGTDRLDGRSQINTLMENTLCGRGLADTSSGLGATGVGPAASQSVPSGYRTISQATQLWAWHQTLASLPQYNYYEVETELADLADATLGKPVTPAEPVSRCTNPVATLLDQVSSHDCHVIKSSLAVVQFDQSSSLSSSRAKMLRIETCLCCAGITFNLYTLLLVRYHQPLSTA